MIFKAFSGCCLASETTTADSAFSSLNNILIIEFNKMGLVKDKTLLDLNDMNDIKIAEKKTNKEFAQDNFVYNLLSTLRNKINAPTRRKK